MWCVAVVDSTSTVRRRASGLNAFELCACVRVSHVHARLAMRCVSDPVAHERLFRIIMAHDEQ